MWDIWSYITRLLGARQNIKWDTTVYKFLSTIDIVTPWKMYSNNSLHLKFPGKGFEMYILN